MRTLTWLGTALILLSSPLLFFAAFCAFFIAWSLISPMYTPNQYLIMTGMLAATGGAAWLLLRTGMRWREKRSA